MRYSSGLEIIIVRVAPLEMQQGIVRVLYSLNVRI